MYRSKEEKLVDTILGEAILMLLERGSTIGSTALIAILDGMSKQEKNPERNQAIVTAMNDVKNNSSSGASYRSVNSTNSSYFFKQESDGKKH
ncbi:hypothetical protein OMR58_25860 [Erwinia sp. INIA-01]|uniref:hypothetical protein n=1 Tax=Erwinia sp. INIA01 TaxID=2991500 RepID=UPI0022257759|nr:hypothetical protein [Erwinia sp. INIA01]MCW1877864.1 hypothetical protein [Erwinia sp. INIA01]